METVASWLMAWIMTTFFMSPLYPNAFSCTDNRAEEIVFSYSEDSVSVFNFRIHTNENKTFPLTAVMPDGSSVVQITNKNIHVQIITDTVVSKIKHPSGEITDDRLDINDPETFRDRIRYHLTFPVLNEYIFDIQTNQLVTKETYLHPARKVRVQEFIIDPSTNYIYPQDIGTLTEEEVLAIVPTSTLQTTSKCVAVDPDYLIDEEI